MLPTKDSLQIKRYTQTKRKEMVKDIALMDLEGITVNEMGRIERNKYHMISCTCGIYGINNNKKSSNRLIVTENTLRAARWERGCGVGKKAKELRGTNG